MAAISRQLPRGLAEIRFATRRLASNFETRLFGCSRTWSGGSAVEKALANVDYRSKLRRDGALDLNTFYVDEINPPEHTKGVDLRRDGSRCTALERYSVSFGWIAECPNFARRRTNFSVDHILLVPDRAYYRTSSAYNDRSVWIAVSDEDKLRPEVDEEELDLKSTEDSHEATVKKRDGHVADGSETSMYTSAEASSPITTSEVNKLLKLSPQDIEQYFGEGFPVGLLKGFDETKESAFLVRARVLQLCDRFRRCQADMVRLKEVTDQGEKARFFASKPRQCLLEGFGKGGKSAALAMLVHWARLQGWLVFYVPNGREWTSVGMFFKNPQTGLFDTPIQAKTALEGFLNSHEKLLSELLCRIPKSLHLGEGAGTGTARGPQQFTLPEGATLRDLVDRGVAQSQAAVSCLVRLREELNLVQEVPVLIAIDEFNTWFTFSSFYESTGARSRQPIHARELSMVDAFRPMEGSMMMATAFSQSVAVGKLPVHLPGVPKGVRFRIPRYNFEETEAMLKYYHSRKISLKDPTEEDIKKLFYLTNGNGDELRTLVRLL